MRICTYFLALLMYSFATATAAMDNNTIVNTPASATLRMETLADPQHLSHALERATEHLHLAHPALPPLLKHSRQQVAHIAQIDMTFRQGLLAVGDGSHSAAQPEHPLKPSLYEASRKFGAASQFSYIQNTGQWADSILYCARSGGLTTWITRTGVVYDFHRRVPKPGMDDNAMLDPHFDLRHAHDSDRIEGHVVKMRFVGGQTITQHQGLHKRETYHNYFLGQDSSKWLSRVPLWGEVRLQEVYAGVDVRLYEEGGAPRFDYIVRPGADPSQIALDFEGTDGVRTATDGRLVLATSLGEVALQGLYAYQEQHGKRVQVACAFRVQNTGNTVPTTSFALGDYDPTLPLVIDPLVYSTYIGGLSNDLMRAIAVDGTGAVYIAGRSQAGYPTTVGAYQTVHGGMGDVIVTKLNATGTGLVYSTYIGGAGIDDARAIAVDGTGAAYVAGYFQGGGAYPTTAGAYQTVFGGGHDVVVTKLNAAGTALVYSTYIGGVGFDEAYGIVVDATGAAYITGNSTSNNYPTTAGAYQTVYGGGWDTFVTKLNAMGNALVYSTYIGGGASEFANAIAVDGAGAAYIAGYSSSGGYPTTAGTYQTVYGGLDDVIVSKLNATGTALLYSTYIGGGASERAHGIALDATGAAYIAGYSNGSYPTTAGAYQTVHGGANDVIVTKLNATGTALVYSTYIGGGTTQMANDIVVDGTGAAYIAGWSQNGYPTTPGAYQTVHGGISDAIITKLSATGTGLVYSTLIGGGGSEEARRIVLDGTGAAYIVGGSSGSYPTTAGAYQTVYGGGLNDVVVTKIIPALLYTWSGAPGASWTGATNWTPSRTAPLPSDILQFNAGTHTPTNVPNETLHQLIVNAGANVQLAGAATGNTLVVGTGGVQVAAGATLDVGLMNPVGLFMNPGATCTVNGRLDTRTREVAGLGSFALAAGGTLATRRLDGINGIGAASGAIQVPGANITYNPAASYEFNPTLGGIQTNFASIVGKPAITGGTSLRVVGGSMALPAPFVRLTSNFSGALLQSGGYHVFSIPSGVTLTLTAPSSVDSDAGRLTYCYVAGTLNNAAGLSILKALFACEGSAYTITGSPINYGINGGLAYLLPGNVTTTSLEYPSGGTGPKFLQIAKANVNDIVTLHDARSIPTGQSLQLFTGRLDVNGNTLTIEQGASIFGGSATTFVINSNPSTGGLERRLPPSSSGNNALFPVGHGTTYTPFELVNTSTAAGTPSAVVSVAPTGAVNAQNPPFSGLLSPMNWRLLSSALTTGQVRLSAPGVSASNLIGQAPVQSGTYTSIGGTFASPTLTSSPITFSGTQFYAIGTTAPPPIYTWNGNVSQDWQVSGNWTPARSVPQASDVLRFEAGLWQVANVPTQSIGRVEVLAGATVTLAGVAFGNTLNVGTGGVSIASGSRLNLGAASSAGGLAQQPVALSMGTGATCTVAGVLNVSTATVAGAGNFALLSGGTLATGRSDGINGTSAGTGSVQVTGTVSYSPAANYEFNSLASQTLNNAAQGVKPAITQAANVVVRKGTRTGGWALLHNAAPNLTVTGALLVESGGYSVASGVTLTLQGSGSRLGLPAAMNPDSLWGTLAVSGTVVNTGGLAVERGSLVQMNGSTALLTGSAPSYAPLTLLQYTGAGTASTGAEFPPTLQAGLSILKPLTIIGGKTVNGRMEVLLGQTTLGTDGLTANGKVLLGAASTLNLNGGNFTANGLVEFAGGVVRGHAASQMRFNAAVSNGSSGLVFQNGFQQLQSLRLALGTSNGLPNTLRLGSALEVLSELRLVSGRMVVSAPHVLVVSNPLSAAIVGGSDTAFVQGTMRRAFPAGNFYGLPFVLPLGVSSATVSMAMPPLPQCRFLPLGLSAIATAAGMVEAEALDGSSGGTAGTGVVTLSASEHWRAAIVSGAVDSARLWVGRSAPALPLGVGVALASGMSTTFTRSTVSTVSVVGGLVGSEPVTTFSGRAALALTIAAPVITSLSPSTLATGTVVTLRGTNFVDVVSVSFGGVAASAWTVISPTEVRATVSTGATGVVQVRTLYGTATTTAAMPFVPPPVITSLSPSNPAAGQPITITGTDFVAPITVRVGGVTAASVQVVSPSEVRVVAASSASAGVVEVIAFGGVATSATVVTPAGQPAVLSFAPAFGVTGSTLTITGVNFLGADRVAVGGVTAASFRVLSPTQIQATLGTGATGVVSVRTPAGVGVSLARWTMLQPPVMGEIVPSTAQAGTQVRLLGEHFMDVREVQIAGITVATMNVQVRSTTEILVVLPTDATTGLVRVINGAGVGTSRQMLRVEAVRVVPEIVSVEPRETSIGGAFVVVGRNLTAVQQVSIGASPSMGSTQAAFEVLSPTLLVVRPQAVMQGRVHLVGLQGSTSSSVVVRVLASTATMSQRGLAIVRQSASFAFAGDELTLWVRDRGVVSGVSIGGVAASNVRMVDSDQVRVVIPPQALMGIENSAGSSGTGSSGTGSSGTGSSGAGSSGQGVVVPLRLTTSTGVTTASLRLVRAADLPLEGVGAFENDSLALVVFWRTSGGERLPPQAARHWLSAAPLGTWQGLTVSAATAEGQRRVVGVDVSGVGTAEGRLRGSIPQVLRVLTGLRRLNLSYQQFSDSLPAALGSLTMLQELRVVGNRLRGTLPAAFARLSRLEVLALDSNEFAGALPAVLCSLQALREFSCAANGFGGDVPSCLAMLRGLVSLNAANNRLSGGLEGLFGSPPLASASASPSLGSKAQTSSGGANAGAVAALPSLERLNLSRNMLTGRLPSSMALATGLQEMVLNNNRLSGNIPEELGSLRLLRVLVLDSNALEGAVPESLTTLTRLREVGLSANRLTALPSFAALTRLTVLRVGGNRLGFGSLEANVVVPEIAYLRQDSVGVARRETGVFGETLSVAANVDGTANRYQWYRLEAQNAERLLEGQTSATLVLTEFRPQDTGAVVAKVRNSRVPGLELITRPITLGGVFPPAVEGLVRLRFPQNGEDNVLTTPEFRWDARAVVAASRYEVQVSADSTFSRLTTTASLRAESSTADMAVTLQGLERARLYYWRVRALNATGAGAWSEVWRFATITPEVVLAVVPVRFGRVPIGSTLRQRTVLRNTGETVLALQQLRVAEATTNTTTNTTTSTTTSAGAEFRVETDVQNLRLPPGGSVPIDLSFTPRTLGERTATLEVAWQTVVDGQAIGSPRQQALARAALGRGAALKLDGVDFDTVLVGRTTLVSARIINVSQRRARIGLKTVLPVSAAASAAGSSAGAQVFTPLSSAQADAVLAAGDTAFVLLQCRAERVGSAEGLLRVEADIDTAEAVVRAVARQRRATDAVARLGLRAVPAEAAPGEPVRLELFVAEGNPQELFRTAQPEIRGTLVVDNTVLALAEQERRVLAAPLRQPSTRFRRWHIPPTRWDGRDTVLLRIATLAVQGDTERTALELQTLHWGLDNEPNALGKVFLDTPLQGTFRLSACSSSTTRRIRLRTGLTLAHTLPHPASQSVEVRFTTPAAENLSISLVDAKGTTVMTLHHAVQHAGEHHVVLAVGHLPSGAYRLLLQDRHCLVSAPLTIVR